jgi:hypothetical protein
MNDHGEYGKRLERIGWIIERLEYDHDAPEEIIEGLKVARIRLTKPNPDEMADILSMIAQYLLEKIRAHEKAGPSRVRADGQMPTSLVAAIGLELLDAATDNFKPYPQLREVMVQLLAQKDYKTQKSRKEKERATAAMLLAVRPDLNNVELSKALQVARKTIVNWRKNSAFEDLLKSHKEHADNPVFRPLLKKAIRIHFLDKDKEELIPSLDDG